jgi:hypothetical protein
LFFTDWWRGEDANLRSRHLPQSTFGKIRMTASYRSRVTALAIIASAAFFGANAFIGLSMGVYWLSLSPADFVAQFFPQFRRYARKLVTPDQAAT